MIIRRLRSSTSEKRELQERGKEEEVTPEVIQENSGSKRPVLTWKGHTQHSAQQTRKDPHQGTSSQNASAKEEISKSFHRTKQRVTLKGLEMRTTWIFSIESQEAEIQRGHSFQNSKEDHFNTAFYSPSKHELDVRVE